MSSVAEFCKENRDGDWIEILRKEYSVIVRKDTFESEDLFIFSYNKRHKNRCKTKAINKESRGLILDSEFNVVCRPFDRFFDLNQSGTARPNYEKSFFREKMDGSLIKVYNFRNKWLISTRTMGPNSEKRFLNLVLRGFGLVGLENFDAAAKSDKLDPDFTYLFELVSPLNQLVIHYEETKMHYLSARNNASGRYLESIPDFKVLKVSVPETFEFDSKTSCYDYLNKKSGLKEGWVVYEKDTLVPYCKIKTKKYLARLGDAEHNDLFYDDVRKKITSYWRKADVTYSRLVQAYRKKHGSKNDFKILSEVFTQEWRDYALNKFKSNSDATFLEIFDSQDKLEQLRFAKSFILSERYFKYFEDNIVK